MPWSFELSLLPNNITEPLVSAVCMITQSQVATAPDFSQPKHSVVPIDLVFSKDDHVFLQFLDPAINTLVFYLSECITNELTMTFQSRMLSTKFNHHLSWLGEF